MKLFVLLSCIVVLVIIIAKIQSGKYFLCKHCSKEFKVKWTQLVFETHALDEHKLTCPYCKTKDFCKYIEKNKINKI